MVRALARALPCALALSLVATAAAGAQVVVNGDFESSFPVPPGTFAGFGPGQSFGGWTVGTGTIDLINGFWQAASGTYSVDLDGSQPGTIFQDLTTTAGSTYSLSFALAGNPYGPPTIKPLDVLWGGALVGTVTFDITGKSATNMGWQTFTIGGLVAAGGTTRLEFASGTNGGVWGPALDDVVVSPAAPPSTTAPEPATVGLVGLGLAMVGAAARRRRA